MAWNPQIRQFNISLCVRMSMCVYFIDCSTVFLLCMWIGTSAIYLAKNQYWTFFLQLPIRLNLTWSPFTISCRDKRWLPPRYPQPQWLTFLINPDKFNQLILKINPLSTSYYTMRSIHVWYLKLLEFFPDKHEKQAKRATT